MKYVIFLGDGMADEPVARLGGKTPLQVARKPNIDRIAREGRTGMFRTLQPDMATGSAVANLSVMGFDPRQCFQGRGVLEAASMGVDIGEHMAMRCNLICIADDGTIKNHSAGHISSAESDQLLEALRAHLPPTMRLHTGVSYRHLLVAEGLNTALECAPPHDHPGERAADLPIRAKKPEAEESARVLNELTALSQEILRDHPVNRARRAAGKDPGNSIWLWSPGRKPKMWTYAERFGVTGGVISAVDLIFGIGVYAGLEKVEVPGATGLADTNYEGKADACLRVLREKDFCYLHVEAPDEAGHEGNLELKIRTIEDFDRRCIGRVLEGLEAAGEPFVCAVLPDHPTPVEKRIHTREPIPVAIRDPRHPADDVQVYDEVSCRTGALGLFEGDAFIRSFFGKPA
ncbi:MAG: cofactor-independent phosphoglycerate mutase [Candidatus Sumerlaeia bacterium]|nr:cofactor-independent phosphoglycerate mutase [Candidatus Sumerlaeia bacterium]